MQQPSFFFHHKMWKEEAVKTIFGNVDLTFTFAEK